MLAGLDIDVLADIRHLGLEAALARVLADEGWTTTFVDRGFRDPIREERRGIAETFPFVKIDPVDARLMPRIQRDQVAIAGRRGAAVGAAVEAASLVHVARETRQGSILLSSNPSVVALGRRHRVPVRSILYVMHCSCRAGWLDPIEAQLHYDRLLSAGRRCPQLTKTQLDKYLLTGEDPRR